MKIINPKPLSEVRAEKEKNKKKENDIKKIPVIEEDVEDVALTTAYALEDVSMTAEMVAYLLEEIALLKDEINTLKGE